LQYFVHFFCRINKPGGCAKITKVHRTDDGTYIEGLDVKYLVGGGRETNLDPAIVSPFETLERGGRKRRGREFLHQREEDLTKTDAENDEPTQPPQGGADLSSSSLQAAALRESNSSRQSITTTYSTPQKRRTQKKLPKKVTPIPKLVQIGKKSDDVSPMTEERDTIFASKTTEEPKEKASVARGLCFDDTVTEQDVAQKRRSADAKAKASQSKDTLSKITPQRRPGVENAQNAGINDQDLDRKPAARPTGPSSVTSSAKKKIIGVRLKTTTGLVASRTGAAKRPQSFSRTTSAYTDKDEGNLTAAAASRKPLLDVYRDEVKKARAFMDEMVAPRDDEVDLGVESPEDSRASGRFIRTTS
jgi:hypothetical protein